MARELSRRVRAMQCHRCGYTFARESGTCPWCGQRPWWAYLPLGAVGLVAVAGLVAAAGIAGWAAAISLR
jgi:hypothetical protein